MQLFGDEEKARIRVSHTKKALIILAVGLVFLFILSLIFCVSVVHERMSLPYVLNMASSRLQDIFLYLSGQGARDGIHYRINTYLLVACIGAGLATCGTVYQGLFRNAIASPTTLGVNSGGMLGGILYVLLFVKVSGPVQVVQFDQYMAQYNMMSLFDRNIRQIFIIAGSLLAVTLIVSIAKAAGRGRVTSFVLMIAGTVFSSVIGTVVGLVQNYLVLTDGEDMSRIQELGRLMRGSFDQLYSYQHLWLAGVPIVVCLAVLMLLRPHMNALVFGEDEAQTMGVRTGLLKNLLIGISTLITAVAIAFCGQIGLVGLIVPHLARRVVGPDYKSLIPASILLGAAVFLVIYDVAFMFNVLDGINLITSIVGAPIVVFIMLRQRRERQDEWF